jgi:hypothetical protein
MEDSHRRRKMTNPDELVIAAAESDALWAQRLELDRQIISLKRQIKYADKRYDLESDSRYEIMKGLSKSSRWFPAFGVWSYDGV